MTTVPAADSKAAATPRPKPVDMAKKYWWVAAIAVPIVVALISIVPDLIGGPSGNTYITNSRVGGDLYITTNVVLTDPAQQAQFDQAVTFARNGQYAQAKALLEQVAANSKSAGVLNNLGVVNAALGDDKAAQASLSQALQIEPANEAAKSNLGLIAKAAAIQSANNTILTAAPIELGTAVESSIAGQGDSDFFSFTAPAKRDLLQIRMDNKSTTLAPDVHVFDAERNEIGREYRPTAGANVEIQLSPAAGGKYFVQVTTFGGPGAYSLSITPQQAFDRFEPNESILEAREITLGQDVEANVMDQTDVDVYKVSVPAGPVQVTLTNRSATLVPDLFLFDENRNQVAREYRPTAGSHTMAQGMATAPGTWYVSAKAFSGAGGAYTLKVSR
jgi:hypothetical protein